MILEMNTMLSEGKKWCAKYLRKLENHSNAIPVNLLDNSKTTQTEKILHLSLPERR
jgi:hypothetical protein